MISLDDFYIYSYAVVMAFLAAWGLIDILNRVRFFDALSLIVGAP